MKALQDIRLHQANEGPLSNNWSLPNAIRERVELEDLVAWAAKPEEPWERCAELSDGDASPFSILRFVQGILP